MQKAICLNHISVKNQSFQNQLLKLHHHKHMVKTTSKNMQARSIYISISYSRKNVYIIIERVSATITLHTTDLSAIPLSTLHCYFCAQAVKHKDIWNQENYANKGNVVTGIS